MTSYHQQRQESKEGRERYDSNRARVRVSTAEAAKLPSKVAISQLMLPSDCTSGGTVFGGTLMKMM